MGFRSTFISEDSGFAWPDWFRNKYHLILNFGRDDKGALSTKHEFKLYEDGAGIFQDIQKAIDWDSRNRYGRHRFILCCLHECGGITRIEISRSTIKFSEPESWGETKGVEHCEGCLGCSDIGSYAYIN